VTRFEVYVQPRASKTELAGTHGGAIKIRISAPALDNAANIALIEFVAAQLGVAKRCVRVAEGVTDDALRAAFPAFKSPERRSSSARK
jgi:uncharacterized protein YggU (UPF0235/DUF167 family)